jgi:hypothetical protein
MCYAVRKSGDLRSLGALYRATARLLTPELAAFVDSQFGRIVGDRREDDLPEALSRSESILIMTVQMLAELQRGRGPLQQVVYEALRENIDLVLFDEGHYEPAAKWSEAVRELAKPVVLLSATPFRNDLKAFRISADNIDLYKFHEAVDAKVIRGVCVERRDPAPTAPKFCDDVIDYCTQLWGADTSRWTQRIIIHCDDMASITRLGETFIARGFAGKVVGIHDRYPSGDPTDGWKRRSVPAPGQCDALIWIHQYKLLEGIDDHRFQVLAFFDVLGNVRSIVQQIGRVIRKGDNDTGLAWVLDHFGGRIKRYWQLYEAFDKSVTREELARAMSKVLIKDFTKVQPPVLYIDKKFRSVLQIQAEEGAQPPMTPEEVADEVLFERRVTLRRVTRTTTLEELTERIEDGLAEGDYEFTKYDLSAVSPDTVIYICAKVDNVGFLNNRYYALPIIEARMVMLFPTRGMVATASTASGSGTDALSHLPPRPRLPTPTQLRRELAAELGWCPHPDLIVVAQPSRTLVPGTDRQSVAARGFSLRAPSDRLDPGIPRLAQREPPPLRVDRNRRIHPRQSRPRTRRSRKVNQFRDAPLVLPPGSPIIIRTTVRSLRCSHSRPPCRYQEAMP